MPTTGAQSPTVGATIAGADQAWSVPGNILVSDNVRAAISDLDSLSPLSNYLKADGFDFSAIDDGDVIVGITVKIESAQTDVGSGGTNDVELWTGDTTGTAIGVDKSVFIDWSSSETIKTFVWTSGELGGLTAIQVKNANFGLALRVKWFSGGKADFLVDHITMDVEHVPSSSPIGSSPSRTASSLSGHQAGALVGVRRYGH